MVSFENKDDLLRFFSFFDQIKGNIEHSFFNSNQVLGKCDYCNSIKTMQNIVASNGEWINRRDQFICEECGLSSRLRSFYNALKVYAKKDGRNVIFEKTTVFFQLLANKNDSFIGTEYFEDHDPGVNVNFSGLTVRNENIMSSTFEDSSFDLVAHQEVLEHVPNPDLALVDNYRILKPGGFLIFTAPFYHHIKETIINAKVSDGEVVHLREPVYHGNPLSEEGSLVFQIFGQNFLDLFFSIGFRKAWIEFDFDVTRCVFSCGNPHPIGQMYPVVFFGYK